MYKKKYIDFLLTCLGTRNDPGVTSRPLKFTESDWFEFIALSRLHRVAPILYKRLKTHRSNKNIPGWVIRKLGVLYVSSAKKQTVTLEEFSKIFLKLKANRVRFIVLKGPHLAEVVYGDWALRPMVDLDILVKEEHLSRAVSSLQAIGYSNRESTKCPQHHLPRFLKEGSAPIEIHHDISSSRVIPCKIDYDGLWRRAQPVKIGGVEVLVLSVEDLLLHLSLHACQHKFQICLMHIYDISAILHHYKSQIDWVELLSRAHLWNAKKALYLTLEVARDLLGIVVPDEVMKKLRPQDYSIRFVKGAQIQTLTFGNISSPFMADMLETKTLLAQFKSICEKLFCPKTMANKYPIDRYPKLIGFYYLLRFIDVMVQYVRLKQQVIRHGKEDVILPSEKIALGLVKWLSTV